LRFRSFGPQEPRSGDRTKPRARLCEPWVHIAQKFLEPRSGDRAKPKAKISFEEEFTSIFKRREIEFEEKYLGE
jgi:hypothetical protein